MNQLLRLFLIAAVFCVVSNSRAQQSPNNLLQLPIQIESKQRTLIQVFQDIEKKYPVRFYFKEEWMPRTSLRYEFNGQALGSVMKRLFVGTKLNYVVYEDHAIVIGRETELNTLESFSYQEYVEEVAQIDQAKIAIDRDLFKVGDSTLRPRPATATLNGTIYNHESEEAITGGQIGFPELGKGTFADSLGRFTIDIPTGTHEAIISGIGHEQVKVRVQAFSDGNWDIPLTFSAYQLEEVLLEAGAEGQSVDGNEAGKVQISMVRIRQSPPLMGEIDVVNTLLLLPGVSSAGEASSGFNVRGGNIDQNLIMQDGQMVFNSSHLFGFFSIFNPDMVKNVTLYKGHMPAQFGGRVSSVLDVDMIEGSYKRIRGRGSVGIFSSKLMINGPLIKDKSSFVIGGRAAYPNILTRNFDNNRELVQSSTYYGDLTGKLTQKFGDNGKLSLFGYWSQDFFRFSDQLGFQWNNLSGGLDWQQLYGSRVSSKVEVNAGRYTSDFFNAEGPEGASNNTGIDNYSLKANVQYIPSSNHNFNIGLNGTFYDIHPNTLEPFGENSSLLARISEKDQGLELAGYINDDFKINEFISFSAGLRFSYYQNLGPAEVFTYAPNLERSTFNAIDSTVYGPGDVIQTYQGLEPRISLRVLVDETASFKASYNRVNQYIHLLANTASTTPIDIWQVSNQHFPAQVADNYSLGFFKNFQGKIWQTSLEVFYRELDGLVVAKDFARLLANPNVETEMLNAEGLAYGAELSIKRDFGKVNIDASFTYMRSLRKTINNAPGVAINRGEWFPSDFDSPFNLVLTAVWKQKPSRTISANFVYRSGRPVTVPVGAFELYPSWTIPTFSDRNQFRIPPYHRLDLAYTFDDGILSRRSFKTDFTISVYNVYARQNPYSVFFQKDGTFFKAFQLSILGTLLPFVGYNFKF
ncbi:MAG: carboxypeptidase-like regulatory domain-containing protein [Bacteroidota bacterium]